MILIAFTVTALCAVQLLASVGVSATGSGQGNPSSSAVGARLMVQDFDNPIS